VRRSVCGDSIGVYNEQLSYTSQWLLFTMRTNIDIDDGLLAEAMRLSGLKTKKAVVDKALQKLIMLHRQAAIRELRGKLKWEGNLEESRLGRDFVIDRDLERSSSIRRCGSVTSTASRQHSPNSSTVFWIDKPFSSVI
jgi:Arc/MetJ family transcription regulator